MRFGLWETTCFTTIGGWLRMKRSMRLIVTCSAFSKISVTTGQLLKKF
jgi:hypothetical protein